MKYQFVHKKIAEALYKAFVNDPFCRTLEESISDDSIKCREGMLKYFDYAMREAQKHGVLYIPNRECFGASLWLKPKNYDLAKQLSREKRAFIQENLGDAAFKKYDSIINFMEEKVKIHVLENSWYLSLVAVSQTMNIGLCLGNLEFILSNAQTVLLILTLK